MLSCSDRFDQEAYPRAIDALNAERDYISNMGRYAESVTQYNIAQADLIRTIGGNPIDGVK